MKIIGIKYLGALCALVVSATVALADAVDTSIVSVKGTVEYAAPGSSDFQKLNKGDRLKVGSKIKTGADGAALIAPFPGAAAQINANTIVALSEVDLTKKGDRITGRKAVLDVSQGSVVTSIDKKAKVDFRVRTPKAIAHAKGTAYSVTQTAPGSWTIVVAEGTVEITLPNGDKRSVDAGEKIVIFADGSTSSVTDATPTEVAAVNASREVAVALNLITGEVTEGGIAGLTGEPITPDLVVINPANISGEVSPSE